MNFAKRLDARIERINDVLYRFISQQSFQIVPLIKAMRYSALLGGKRLRSFLVYETGNMFGINDDTLDAPAAAVEYIHAYSLIHDDLPALDNNDLRRGQPACHVLFGEANAILAGNALQSMAFSILSNAPTVKVEDYDRLEMISELAMASGVAGMCGGQALDLKSEGHFVDPEQLEYIHRYKTGALIRAAVRLGALSAGSRGRDVLPILDKYAENIGLAFQVQDDILDVVGDTKVLGKKRGMDRQLSKNTYPARLGLKQAICKAKNLIDDAQRSLTLLNAQSLDTSWLEAVANYIIQRDK